MNVTYSKVKKKYFHCLLRRWKPLTGAVIVIIINKIRSFKGETNVQTMKLTVPLLIINGCFTDLAYLDGSMELSYCPLQFITLVNGS